MATERIQIIVTSKGTVTVRKDIEGIGHASRTASDGLQMLKGLAATWISAATISRITQFADSFQGVQNRLRLVTGSQEELANKTQELLNIANNSRQEFEAIATLYQRTAQAVQSYGISAERTTKFVDLLAQATATSGATTIESSNALRQLAQGLASGELRGEEFRSVMENLPAVARAIADGLEVDIGKLREMAYDGQLTPQLIISAFEKVGPAITAAFETTVPTIGQALTVLNNNFTAFVGQIQTSTGIFSVFAQAILWVADNLDTVMLALTPLAGALTILAVQTIGTLVIGAFTGFISAITNVALAITTTMIPAVVRLTTVMLTNPLFAVGAAAVITGIVLMKDRLLELGATIEDTVVKMAGLDQFGEWSNGDFNINIEGKQFAANANSAISAGGAKAANDMKKGIEAGGANAASQLKSAQDAAMARYEALNGKVVQELGNTLTEGGDYIYNQVDGSIRAATPEMKNAIEAGGGTAGDIMEKSIARGGEAAAKVIYDSVESAYATLAPLADVFYQFESRARKERELMGSEAAKNRAERQKLLAEAEAIRHGRSPNSSSYSSSRGGGGGSSTSAAGGWHPNIGGFNHNPTIGNPSKAGPTGQTKVTITNVVDAGASLEALDTHTGENAILNVIRNRSEELRSLLGVA